MLILVTSYLINLINLIILAMFHSAHDLTQTPQLILALCGVYLQLDRLIMLYCYIKSLATNISIILTSFFEGESKDCL